MRTTSLRPIILLAGACALAAGQGEILAQVRMAGPDPSPKELKLGADSVSVPMERFDGWAIVEALIDGKGPYRFLIDTGAPGLLVDSRLKQEMGLSAHPDFGGMGAQVQVAGPGGQGRPAGMHFVKSLKIGNSELLGLTVIATELPFPSDIAGVIGMGVFKDCLLTLDYPTSKVTLTRGELPPANGHDILDFTQPRQARSIPVIAVEMCGEPTEFALDSGMGGWVAFTEEMAQRCTYAYGPVDGPKRRMVDREIDTRVARLNGRMKFGAYTVEKPYGVVSSDADRHTVIGSRILQNFAVTLDQKNSRVRFAREDTSPIVPPPYRLAGFRLQRQEEGFVVWGVMAGSPAQRAGIKNGDVVVSINDKPVAEVYGLLIWDQLLQSNTLDIRYKPAGESNYRRVELEVCELLP
jgi:hypothetical protein